MTYTKPLTVLTLLAVAAPAFAQHDARTALDWPGRYEGVLPCASCEGIQTVLLLAEDGTYQLIETYLGEDDAEFIENGTFIWEDDGTRITLDDEDKRGYFVAEGSVIALNADNEPAGDDYVLAQTTEADMPPLPDFDEIAADGAEFVGEGQNLSIKPRSPIRFIAPEGDDHYVVFGGVLDFEHPAEDGHLSLAGAFVIHCDSAQLAMPLITYYADHDAKGDTLHKASDNGDQWTDLPGGNDVFSQAADALCH
ncbi:MAG: copper resistance protein NlpE [Paracoccus sp. (in: a-proteobacteria)]|nr:copper resistance protein NlpE [Paracoccus sp. (in: a-proteobacteria)]